MARPLTDVGLPDLPAGPAGRYGADLLGLLGASVTPAGTPGVPPRSPAHTVQTAMAGAALAWRTLAHGRGCAEDIDGPALLGRARPAAGRTARLLSARDGPIAVNLARPSDWDLVPAWLEWPTDRPATWSEVADAVRTRCSAPLAARAGELGLAVTPCPASGLHPDDQQFRHRHPTGAAAPWVMAGSTGRPRVAVASLQVVDLSALWAGPLLGSLLAQAGASVSKVEDPCRRDASRPDATSLSRRLNRSKHLVEVPFDDDGREALASLLATADVVIEGSRPRVLDQLGLGPGAGRPPDQIWVSITAFGRTGPWSGRVGYGDDTAAAGGLYGGAGDTAGFVGDTVADPLTGLHGAVAVLAAVVAGWSGHIDLALRDTAATALGAGAR